MRAPVEGPPIHYMTDEAAEQIAAEIAEAGGSEVFFIGRRGNDGLIFEIESHAFGTARAVPVLMNLCKPGEVIIHNHPSGQIHPSDADIEVSAALGNVGVGSLIVNNDCTRVRVIVRPHDVKEKAPVNLLDVERLLGPSSDLAVGLGDYEDRPQQRRMAQAVAEAFNKDGIAVIEAGTGTGKSLAYLVPSLLYALENKERVVVSTHTINLQEQVLLKDLPIVQRTLGRDFRAELVKGRSNYVCKRKAQFARDEIHSPQQSLIEDGHLGELREVLSWAKESKTGDRQELSVPPREEVWERVGSEADNCLRLRCQFYDQCFFYNSRRRAARADVLVVNHSLLMSDIAVRRESNNWSTAAVLPPYQHVILDEAHHLEEVATSHLAWQISRLGVRRLFNRLLRSENHSRKGVLQTLSDTLEKMRGDGLVATEVRAWRILVMDVLPSFEQVRDTLDSLLENFGYAFLEVARLDRPRQREEHRVRVTPAIASADLWTDECSANVMAFARELETFISRNKEALSALSELDEEPLKEVLNTAMEWRSIIDRMDHLRRQAHHFLKNEEKMCRWIELKSDRRDRLIVRLCQAPISVAALLAESLHRRTKSEVLTSATLAVDGDFDFLCDRVGINLNTAHLMQVDVRTNDNDDNEEAHWEEDNEEETRLTENAPPRSARDIERLLLDTPFNYREQVFFGVPTDLGDPRNREFEGRLGDFIVRAVGISGGRAFVLFTSYTQMRRVYTQCTPLIQSMGIKAMIQGEESRDRLLRRFRQDETSVLFATSSFWEGVDVKGRALELLIIARLPFAVPSDPIQEAQYEYLQSQGRDPFSNLVVPRAIIRFKQGFGRLIRSRTDRGAVIIADDRVVRMPYGRRFLRSLPDVEVRSADSGRLLNDLGMFFSNFGKMSPLDLDTARVRGK